MPRISRREFLKIATVTSAAALASQTGVGHLIIKESDPLSLAKDMVSDSNLKVRYFVCRICGGGCVLKGYVTKDGGRLVKIEGDSRDWVSHGTPCVKGKSSLKMLYDPNRLKKPLIRTNKDRGFIKDDNGALVSVIDPKWKEVTWDEALDLVADKIAEAIREWGPQSIVFIGHGKGGALANLIGTPNIVKHHTTCHSTWDVGLKPIFGGVPNADMVNSRLIISFGFDQGAGKSKNPFSWLFAEAKKNGAKIVVFEPRLSETANKADEWIPIKPGTDVVVALAMINTIIEKELYDIEFLLKYTNAPLLIDIDTNSYIKDEEGNLMVYDKGLGKPVSFTNASSPTLIWNGEYNGKNVATAFYLIKERVKSYTPEWAENISGVPASKIISIAEEFATTKPASIPHWKRSGGTGPNRAQGIETYKAIAILMTLTGNIEIKGGWLFNRNAGFISKAISKKPKKKFSDLYPIPDEYKGKTIDEKEKFPIYKKYTKEGVYQKVWYNILNDNPYPVKVIVVWAQGLQAFMDYDLIEKAVRHVVEDNNGIIVNVNIYPDEMATLADVVLPEKLFLEGGPSIGYSKSFDISYRIHWVDGIEPIYPDVKSEKWITENLAYKIGEKLGISGDELKSKYMSEYFLVSSKEALYKMIDLYNKKVGVNLTLEDLMEKKIYYVNWRPKNLTKLSTVSGRIEIFPVELATYGYEPLPIWQKEFTYDVLNKGELVLVTSVFSMNRHSKTVNNEWLRYFLAKHHANGIWIHPSTAKQLGVEENSIVLLEAVRPFNKSIAVHLPKYRVAGIVHITEAVRPDVVFVPHGTGQLSPFMDSYDFGLKGGDGVVKPVLVDYHNPSASSSDQDIIVRVVRIHG